MACKEGIDENDWNQVNMTFYAAEPPSISKILQIWTTLMPMSEFSAHARLCVKIGEEGHHRYQSLHLRSLQKLSARTKINVHVDSNEYVVDIHTWVLYHQANPQDLNT